MLQKPNEFIFFKAQLEYTTSTLENLLQIVPIAREGLNDLLLQFYKCHPNVVRTIDQLHDNQISYYGFFKDWVSVIRFEVNIPFENNNYVEELKKYNEEREIVKKQKDDLVAEKKAKQVALSEANRLLKNANKDKIEKIIELLNKE